MNPKVVELLWSLLKHAAIVGAVAFLVALGQALAGADWSGYGPFVGPVVIPAVVLLLSTLVKALQKGVELKLRRDDPPNGDESDPFLPFGGGAA